MTLALQEAILAGRRGDRPIGCVIVHDGNVISRGRNAVHTKGSELEHAEMLALRHSHNYLSEHAKDCVLFTTLEPCTMCLGAIAAMGIGSVVYGEPDPRRGGTEVYECVEFVRENVTSYRGGVLSEKCALVRAGHNPSVSPVT